MSLTKEAFHQRVARLKEFTLEELKKQDTPEKRRLYRWIRKQKRDERDGTGRFKKEAV
jgi:hypothetical protein